MSVITTSTLSDSQRQAIAFLIPASLSFPFAARFMKTGLLSWMKKGLACFPPWRLVSLARARGAGQGVL